MPNFQTSLAVTLPLSIANTSLSINLSACQHALINTVYGASQQLIKSNIAQNTQGGSNRSIAAVADVAYPSGTHTYSVTLSPNISCTSLAATSTLTLGGVSVLTLASLNNYSTTTANDNTYAAIVNPSFT